jgi:hypothetical protein
LRYTVLSNAPAILFQFDLYSMIPMEFIRIVTIVAQLLQILKFLVVGILCISHCPLILGSVSESSAASSSPSPPVWDNQFMFVASVSDSSTGTISSAQVFYDWSIPAMRQVFTNNYGQVYSILHLNTKVFRVNGVNSSCCWCTSPDSCGNGNVLPPFPNWLQTGNSTKYAGISSINERECQGWVKLVPGVAEFGWWTSVATGLPCQLAWLLGFQAEFVISYYSKDKGSLPSNIFQLPNICKGVPPDPNHCSISGF